MGNRQEKRAILAIQDIRKFTEYGRFEKNANNFHKNTVRQTRKQGNAKIRRVFEM